MIALWNRLVDRGSIFDLVALEHGDAIEIIGEHPRSHQSRYATPDHNCMVSQSVRHIAYTPALYPISVRGYVWNLDVHGHKGAEPNQRLQLLNRRARVQSGLS